MGGDKITSNKDLKMEAMCGYETMWFKTYLLVRWNCLWIMWLKLNRCKSHPSYRSVPLSFWLLQFYVLFISFFLLCSISIFRSCISALYHHLIYSMKMFINSFTQVTTFFFCTLYNCLDSKPIWQMVNQFWTQSFFFLKFTLSP